MRLSRRRLLNIAAGAGVLAACAPLSGLAAVAPRQRVIIDNDFAGDPDGLYQSAHHLLSPSVDVRFLIGSHSHQGENWGHGPVTSEQHAARARELVNLARPKNPVRVLSGLAAPLADVKAADPSPTSQAIIEEAMSDSTGIPLFYAAGAGLTDLANAWLLEPRIGRRMRLLWIGGSEYPGVLRPPGPQEEEYNLTIDIHAAQVIFNHSDIEIWQVPRNTYRQMLIGWSELEARSRSSGALGAFLADSVADARNLIASAPPSVRVNPGEAYVLGDSPLVTLTVLQSPFQADASSSSYEQRPCPMIDDKGQYGAAKAARMIRVYTHIDARMTFEDMFAKLAHSGTQAS